MKVLDLCSGLGGFSEAFAQAGHKVVRIENNPLLRDVPHTNLMCIFELRDWIEDNLDDLRGATQSFCGNVDLILFSPPCYEFSLAYNAPRVKHERDFPNVPWEPSMDILECGMDIIKMLKPTWHIVENVRGAIKYFKEDLGKPFQINDAYVFWGKFPSFAPAEFPSKADKDSRHSPLRANIRGKVPIEISKALLEAIVSQKSILDY
jgi:site-specific DNA-cytosine methylase